MLKSFKRIIFEENESFHLKLFDSKTLRTSCSKICFCEEPFHFCQTIKHGITGVMTKVLKSALKDVKTFAKFRKRIRETEREYVLLC